MANIDRSKIAVAYPDQLEDTDIPTIGQLLESFRQEFTTLAYKQSDGSLSLRELAEGITDIGRKVQYWHNRAEKLAMREMYRQANAHEKDKFYALASGLPKSAV